MRVVILIIAVFALMSGGRLAWAGGKSAMVEVGFTGAPPPGFQNVLLNVQAVRINPHANAGPSSGQWQRIPTPPGIGGGSQKAELQIDLNTTQNVPDLFNMAKVRPDNYKVAQILLDPTTAGALIPNCPQSPGGPEGCISYPIALTNGQVITAPISMLAPSNKTAAVLVLQAQLTIIQAPTVAGGAYEATLTMTQSTTAMGIVTGGITSSGSSSGAMGKVRKLTVTGETIGTNTAIANALIKSSTYTLMLPAAPGFGTLYDLAVSGGGDSYGAARLPPLYPGATINGPTFAVTGQTLGNVTGTVMDGCAAGTPITSATLQLLVPPASNPTFDCIAGTTVAEQMAAAAQCVTVASATTDNAGNFPLPGTLTTPSQFENVPGLPKSGAYAMEVTAPGYDPLFVQVKPSTGTNKNNGGVCAPVGSTSFSKCKLLMTTAYITGTIPIVPQPSGGTTTVEVFAENSGTNNIQSASPLITNKNGNTLVSFTMNVPSSVASFDLFATTIDQYQGVSDPYQGHSIVVLSDVPQPGQCNTSSPVAFEQTIECVGHGSVVGTANNANLGASVALEKLDESSEKEVQITTGQIQNQLPNSSPSNSFAFCAPADTYQLQPIQLPQAAPSETPFVAPSPEPAGDPTTVTIIPAPIVNGGAPTPTSSGLPTPTATPTFKITCPTTCLISSNSCPGICNTTIGAVTIPTLPPPVTQTTTATPTATATP